MLELANETLFTSEHSVASAIEELLQQAHTSVDAAVYRITNPRLARALGEARNRGLQVRLLVDRNKYEKTSATRELLAENSVPFHAIYGRKKKGSKLHHKFAVLDGHVLLTGSYNWTIESEEKNYDHMLIIRDPKLVLAYQHEFDRLWPSETEDSAT
ncbi:MAG: phospholipase D-like domain-containing protein [Acidobacteriota bacterium]